jgi:putative addiction module component (TIGR02574 family)
MSSEFNYLLSLDVPEKLELIGALWQSIDTVGQKIEMPDSLVAELDRRKAAAERDPTSLIDWEVIRQEAGLGHD